MPLILPSPNTPCKQMSHVVLDFILKDVGELLLYILRKKEGRRSLRPDLPFSDMHWEVQTTASVDSFYPAGLNAVTRIVFSSRFPKDQSRKYFNLSRLLECRSRLRAFFSICLILSRETLKRLPISSRVYSAFSPIPKRRRMIFSSL